MSEMTQNTARRLTLAVTTGFVLLIAAVGGAAERIVLSEYFTNQL